MTYCSRSKRYNLLGDRPLSYTRTREIILDALGNFGLHKSTYSLHSLRSGGASTDANVVVSDRL